MYAVTELELAEYSVKDITNSLNESYSVHTFAAPCAITKKSDRLKGRRAAIITDNRLLATTPPAFEGDGLDDLRASGRWTESSVPIDNASTCRNVAVYYGVAGASEGGECMANNERYLKLVFARAIADPTVPYVLCVDANIQEAQSAVIQTILRGSHMVNVRADRQPDTADVPTYCKGGITQPLTEGQAGCSNTDFVLANQAAINMIQDIELLWHDCDGLDHVPLQITFQSHGFQGTHDALNQGTHINVQNLIPLEDHQADALYCIVRAQCDHEANQMENTEDLGLAHLLWSKIAEVYLHTWAAILDPHDIDDCAHCIANRIIVHDRKRSAKYPTAFKSALRRIPALTRGVLAETAPKPNLSRLHRMTILASNAQAEVLSQLDRRCRHLALVATRLGKDLSTNFEARTLANKVKKHSSCSLG